MKTLDFFYNWNNNLANKAFTSLRLHNAEKYQVGELFEIRLKGKILGTAELRDKRTIRLSSLNCFVSYLDTGYGVDEMKRLIKNIYKNKNIDPENQSFDYLLLVFQTEPGSRDAAAGDSPPASRSASRKKSFQPHFWDDETSH